MPIPLPVNSVASASRRLRNIAARLWRAGIGLHFRALRAHSRGGVSASLSQTHRTTSPSAREGPPRCVFPRRSRTLGRPDNLCWRSLVTLHSNVREAREMQSVHCATIRSRCRQIRMEGDQTPLPHARMPNGRRIRQVQVSAAPRADLDVQLELLLAGRTLSFRFVLLDPVEDRGDEAEQGARRRRR